MIRRIAVGAGIALASLAASTHDAQACGGCFVPEGVNTQVSSHRMVLSLSNERTTLWDQIVYVGEPESFAWVLPTRGVVEVGLSSDAMFQALESMTVVTVLSPPACGFGGNDSASAAAEDSAGSSGPPSKGSDEEAVEVTAHEVVGPYETVQLSSDDPEALRDWLEEHGYAIPDDVAPLVDDYGTEGFDFLAPIDDRGGGRAHRRLPVHQTRRRLDCDLSRKCRRHVPSVVEAVRVRLRWGGTNRCSRRSHIHRTRGTRDLGQTELRGRDDSSTTDRFQQVSSIFELLKADSATRVAVDAAQESERRGVAQAAAAPPWRLISSSA